MKIGPYEIIPIETGFFRLDGGAMFGVVPKTIWEKTNPADEKNRILMSLRTLLLKSSKHKILIDAGIGDKFDEKYQKIYAINHRQYNLLTSLEKAEVKPEEIDAVIFSHLHFDHCGGAVSIEGGEYKPTFPKAIHYIQRANWEQGCCPSEKDRASYLEENFKPLYQKGKLKLLSGSQELFPGVKVFTSDGHTIGQQWVKVSDREKSLVFCADLIPTSTHIRIPYVMGYDLYPMTTMDEKRELLGEAALNQWILVFEHDPYVSACIVKRGEKDFEIDAIVDIGAVTLPRSPLS
ncbi:MAG: MBL fold metallo-hydrolase [Deltaproteobacteria bacterium]|nr:MBL fold metallo-hydrolase [Deltaproteobacteria bacterium]